MHKLPDIAHEESLTAMYAGMSIRLLIVSSCVTSPICSCMGLIVGTDEIRLPYHLLDRSTLVTKLRTRSREIC